MPKIESLSEVGVFVRDQKKAKEFYTKKLGFVVRDAIPEMGYLTVGATKKGSDASLQLWQPTREQWRDRYDKAMSQIGIVTGIGFRTANLEKTVTSLRRRKVKVDEPGVEGGERIARIHDPDGNVFFAVGPSKPKAGRAGLLALEFITVASRDARKADEFFRKALGMKGRRIAGEPISELRLSPRGTALSPFTPTKEMYEDPKDYDEDMAHVGEETGIMFETKDIHRLQEELMAKGVRFSKKAEKAEWGGTQAEFMDPDDNTYVLYQNPR